MAITIKRTPVLNGKAASNFNELVAKGKTKETKASISRIVSDAKAVLKNYKSKK